MYLFLNINLRKMFKFHLGLLIAFNCIWICVFAKSSSNYLGEFLIPQSDDFNPTQYGLPHHFFEYQKILKIKDPIERESLLRKSEVRVKRSPQFGGRVNLGLGKDRGEKAASINTPGISAGLNLNTPQINPKFPEAGINLGGGESLGVEGSIGSGDAGIQVVRNPPNLNLGGNFGVGGGGEAGIGGGEIGVGGNAEIGLGKVGADAKLGLGKLNADAKTDIGKIGADAELGFGNVGADAKFDIEKIGGDVSLGGGNLGSELELGVGKLGADVKTEIGKLGADARLDLGKLKADGEIGLGRIQGDFGFGFEKPDAPTPVNDPSDSPPIDKKEEELNDDISTSSSSTTTTTEDSLLTDNAKAEDDLETTATATTTRTPAHAVINTTDVPEPPKGELYLPPDYKTFQIPTTYDASLDFTIPVPCYVFVRIIGINSIDELKESVSLHIDLTVEWVDGKVTDVLAQLNNPRKYTKKERQDSRVTLANDFLKKLWRPDIYMQDVVSVSAPTISNKAVLSLGFDKISGYISYTVRMTVEVNCPMNFVYYPADTHTCEFKIGSYSYANDEISLDWLQLSRKDVGVGIDDESEDNFDIKIGKITKTEFKPQLNNAKGRVFELLTFTMSARRKLNYHLIQTYLPSVFNIFVTWLVFLLPYSLYDCRIGTTMTTLLTLTAMFSSVREQSPQVSYIKAVDIWMLACVFFIFLTLVELSIMTWLRITFETFDDFLAKADEEQGSKAKENQNIYEEPPERKKIEKMRKVYLAGKKYSFATFAIIFVVFNIIYWTWLLIASKYLEWNSKEQGTEL